MKFNVFISWVLGVVIIFFVSAETLNVFTQKKASYIAEKLIDLNEEEESEDTNSQKDYKESFSEFEIWHYKINFNLLSDKNVFSSFFNNYIYQLQSGIFRPPIV